MTDTAWQRTWFIIVRMEFLVPISPLSVVTQENMQSPFLRVLYLGYRSPDLSLSAHFVDETWTYILDYMSVIGCGQMEQVVLNRHSTAF
jgi:hypothetical protein